MLSSDQPMHQLTPLNVSVYDETVEGNGYAAIGYIGYLIYNTHIHILCLRQSNNFNLYSNITNE